MPAPDRIECLRAILAEPGLEPMPCCFDALSARLVERAGFRLSFMSGFAVSAARLGLPDTGQASYGEMRDQGRDICAAVSIPVIGDADTGYGNAINAERTLLGCAQAGLACVMIEDQQWPKRCGHTAGKVIVDRDEALRRIRACARVREEHDLDILIMARTDSNATDGFDEALWRSEAFVDAGADITFLEAPESLEQMRRYCETVPGFKTANLVEDGKTPWLAPNELADVGYSVVLYPVSLLLHTIHAMQAAAGRIANEGEGGEARVRFDEARQLLGWPVYEERLRDLERIENKED